MLLTGGKNAEPLQKKKFKGLSFNYLLLLKQCTTCHDYKLHINYNVCNNKPASLNNCIKLTIMYKVYSDGECFPF